MDFINCAQFPNKKPASSYLVAMGRTCIHAGHTITVSALQPYPIKTICLQLQRPHAATLWKASFSAPLLPFTIKRCILALIGSHGLTYIRTRHIYSSNCHCCRSPVGKGKCSYTHPFVYWLRMHQAAACFVGLASSRSFSCHDTTRRSHSDPHLRVCKASPIVVTQLTVSFPA
jgi:hypothetical protein